mgnify:CR=1 FL=1
MQTSGSSWAQDSKGEGPVLSPDNFPPFIAVAFWLDNLAYMILSPDIICIQLGDVDKFHAILARLLHGESCEGSFKVLGRYCAYILQMVNR